SILQHRYQTDLAASRFEHDYELTVLPNTRRDCGIAEFGITAPRYFFTVDFQRQSERKRLTLRVGRGVPLAGDFILRNPLEINGTCASVSEQFSNQLIFRRPQRQLRHRVLIL